jgi:putative addiction module antidote
MATSVKITAIGNSAGVILPREVMAKLHVEKGDQLYIIETPNGIELTPYNKEFAEEMESARRVMRKHRDVLRKLAE